MRTEAPILLPLFRSRGQAHLLARVFLHPDERVSLNQLARELGLDPATVQREAERLEEAGILTSDRIGRARLVRPNEESPFYPELSGLVFKAFGPVPVLRERLKKLAGVDAAFIYGSWARRYTGERGEAPGDIDLLILGTPDRRKLARLCREAGEELRFEVSPTVLSKEEWESDATGFIRSIKEQPLVPLTASVDDLGTSHSAISRIESGQHRTSVATLQRLAEALDVRFVMGFESGPPERPVRELVSA